MTEPAASSPPVVSVVIPHFNRSELLRFAVDSVLASTAKRFEVIIVDDGSSDDELAAAKQLSGDKVRVIKRTSGPKGPSRCRNLGVDASTAEYVVFLDSDDFMAPWCLETRLAAVKTEPDADLWVFPVLLFENDPGDGDRLWNRMDNGTPPELRFIRSDPPWHTSSPIWRKSAFMKVGGFNEKVFYGDDSDLHMRAIIEGCSIRLNGDAIPDVFVRRSGAPRITNEQSSGLRENRIARLTEGTRYLKKRADNRRFLSAIEGQYFAEAEFLLFNESAPETAVNKTLEQWRVDLAPDGPPAPASAYFRIALMAKSHAYSVLRLARRAVMTVLPKDFFSSAPDFANLALPEAALDEVRSRLAYQFRGRS